MSNALRKTLAVFLCFTMCLSLFPAAGFAEDYLEEELLLESDYTDEPAISDMEEVVIEEKAVEEEILEEDFVFDDATNAELREPEEIAAPVEPIEQESLPEANAGENGTVVEELDEAAVFADPEPSASEVYTALVAACAANYEGEYNLEGFGEIEITDNLSIPVNMHVKGYGFKIIVPSGVTLTVYGEFNVRELLVQQGGEVVVDSIYQPENFSAHMDIPHAITVLGELRVINHSIIDTGIDVWKSLDLTKVTCSNYGQFFTHYEATTELELQNSYADILNNNLNTRSDMEPFVEIRFPFEAGQNTVTSVPAHTRLRARQGAYIPQGVTFTVSERAILAVIGDNLVVDGALVNNGRINLHDSSLIFSLTGEYSQGEHAIVYNGENITIDTSASEAYTALRDACAANYEGEYDLTGLGRIVIAQSLSIPVNMHVRGYGSGIVIPDGVTLTVYGEFNVSGLLIQQGGKVVVNGEQQPTNSGAHMDIPDAIMLEGELELINRGSIDTGMNVWKDLDKSKITYNQGGFCTHYDVTTVEELQAAYNDIVDNHLNTYTDMEPFVEVRFPFEAQITSVPTHTRVRTYDGAHIPQGVTFTVQEGGTFAIFNENLVVDGALVNNGRINLNGPIAVLGETGSYDEGENGGMYRNGARFTFKTNAELLAELEQAVANGDNYFNLAGMGDFELTNGLTIPSGQRFRLECWGTNLTLPAGKTVRVESGARFELHDLIVPQGASVIVADGGYLNVYDYFELAGTLTAGNNVRLHIPAETERTEITLGESCDINVHFRPTDEQELRSMLTEAEEMEAPFYPDFQLQFPWELNSEITFNSVHLTINGNRGNFVIGEGGVLRLNGGLYSDGAVITIENGGRLINNRELELDENNGVQGRLQVNDGGVYTGSGVIAVKNVPFESAENYITGLDLTSFNKMYDEGWNATIFVDTGAVLTALQSAIENHESFFDMNNLGPVSLDENETLVIPEGMHVSAWGTTLVVPATATLNVIGDYSGTGLELYGQLLMGKGEVDWERENSNVNIRDHLVFGENAEASVGLQANFGLPAYALTDEVIENQIHRLHDTSWVHLMWNAYQVEQINDAITRTPTLPERINGHADIRFPWVINGTVEIPSGLNLFVDGAYDNGSITISEGATLISNDFINLNAAPMTVNGTLINNNRVEVNYDSGDRYTGYGTINFGQNSVYTGSGDLRVPNDDNAGQLITGLDLSEFEASDDYGYTSYRKTGEIWEAFATACSQSYDDYFGYDLSNLNNFTLQDSITIPQNMDVNFWSTNLIIPAGKTLTVNGGLHGHQLTVNGQLVLFDCDCYIDTVTVGDSGHVTLHDWANLHTEWYHSPDLFYNNNKVTFEIQNPENHTEILFAADAPDDTEFGILMNNFNELEDHYYGKIRVAYDKVLTSNLDAEAHGVQLEVLESLTVNPGVTLRTAYLGLIGGDMNVNGTLISNHEIRLQPDHDRGVPTGTITFANDVSYVSESGWFFVTDTDNPGSHIQGLNMDRFDIARYSDRDIGYHVKDSGGPIEYAANLVISSETLRRGDQVTVSVFLDEGIGAKMAQFGVQYDSSLLRLVSCEPGELLTDKAEPMINDENAGAVYFVWADTDNALEDSGTLLYLTFEEAAEGYTGSTVISFADEADDYETLFQAGSEETAIPVNTVPGSVKIMDIILGDIDNSGKINVVDAYIALEHAVMLRTLEGAAFTAADVNRDGFVDAFDANIISRYVARYIREF